MTMRHQPERDAPHGYTWGDLGWRTPPQSIPHATPDPDRRDVDQTVLVQHDGKTPLIVRRARPLGFRPDRLTP